MLKILLVRLHPDPNLVKLLRQPGFQVEERSTLPCTLPPPHPEILMVDQDLLDLELLMSLRASMPYTVIIIISHGHDLEAKIDYLNAGADIFFEEPLSPSLLLAHIQALMRRKHLLPDLVVEEEAEPVASRWQKVRQQFKRWF